MDVAAGGITVWIVGQALINIGVVLPRLPGARRAAAVHVSGRHVAAVGADRPGVLLAFARLLPASIARREAAIASARAARERAKLRAVR